MFIRLGTEVMSIESCDGLTITSNEGTLFKAFRNTEGLGIRILRNVLLNVFMKCFFMKSFYIYIVMNEHIQFFNDIRLPPLIIFYQFISS